MKKHFNIILILLTITCCTFSFLRINLMPSARATYVEGPITQDTVWTLVDSPIVVLSDVTVSTSATLRIEPEVEVRFGLNSSLTINGRLIANGTTDKIIRFTSNKIEPQAGDWATIKFLGTQQSTLIYCIVEYGTNGTTIEDSNLVVKNSIIRYNSENGIAIANGNAEVMENEIASNTMNGIYITGSNELTIENNSIESNGDGLVLTGGTVSGVDIQQNNISHNSGSGITLDTSALVDSSILENVLSSNSYGFYVSANSSTYITRNYVFNNSVGFFYANSINHVASFNDIYSNEMGMDVSPSATVNAEHNYWGNESGPYHESLNPHGKGNPVGGDGVNLDFIFFLTKPIDYNNIQPTAVLWTDKTLASRNQTVTFIGTNSYDDGKVTECFFDFGDGENTGWTTLTLVFHNYSSVGNYTAKLRVRDDFGAESNEASTIITVSNLPPLDVSVTLNDYIVDYNGNVSVTVYVSNGTNAVESANVTLFAANGGSFAPNSGLTDQNGYFTATFTAPDIADRTHVRIIAKASKSGYSDGADHKYIEVLPPLVVQIDSEPAVIRSEEISKITVYVTDSFEVPIVNASLVLFVDNGNLSAIAGVTDAKGIAEFNYDAPQTLTVIEVTIETWATKFGYAGGYSQKLLTIEPKILTVMLAADPDTVFSEETLTITVHVTYDSMPVPNAEVTISSDKGGNFSYTTSITDSRGDAQFVLTAPQTTTLDGLNITISATATKNGYVAGTQQTIIFVKPKILVVQISANPVATVSEGKINISIHVSYDNSPIAEANVTITSESGTFNTPSLLTNLYGNAAFTFTAPQVNASLNITINARASKAAYANGENQLLVTVNPGILDVEVAADPSEIMSGEVTVITVHVSCNSTPVAGASITVSSYEGTFDTLTGTTDEGGNALFIFTSPRVTVPSAAPVMANASKNGFVGAQGQTMVSVTPQVEGGWPLMTILLILIPLVIVIVVVVLIKLKIIVISPKEEG